MFVLIRARNDLVHYKMHVDPPPYLRDLENRGIAMTTGNVDADYVWPHRLSSSEVIRWANNTTVEALVGCVPSDGKKHVPVTVRNFLEISEEPARARLAAADLT
jgi:hypothetical protein